jgi:uncharacterized protein DUF1553/uncharacterized protein DUF1549/cytochrome c
MQLNLKRFYKSIYFKLLAMAWVILVIAVSCNAEKAKKINLSAIDYNLHVRPIINENCIVCHGGVKKSSNLSFLFREEALAVNKSGKRAIVPGDPGNSEMIARINNHDSEERMPLDHDPLSDQEIRILTKWIEQGAEWKNHWAYIPPMEIDFTKFEDDEWVKNPIDQFILDRLEAEGIIPSAEADKVTLIRRVSLDITGVPPSIEEVNQFVNDNSENAYEKVVDRLLDSPQYGERWSSMWLDLARYGDTKGYQKDLHRDIWKYRDWLIDAFNANMPFDQFTIEQLAGDLLPNASKDQLIATAFHRNSMTNDESGTDNEEFRNSAVLDRVNTTWEVWQGTTFSCVQCHGHPYDPFKHEEYYEFFAAFNNTEDADLQPEVPFMEVYTKEEEAKIDSIKDWIAENGNNSKTKKEMEDIKPTKLPVMKELEGEKRRESYVFVKGNWMDKGETVTSGVPDLMPDLPNGVKVDRLGIAKWLVSGENPLTARVTVNRFWAQLFGKGIVETLDDFGSQGAAPTHLELLDWMALEFQGEMDWNMKSLLKLMVTSATYKQSSIVTPEGLEKDPYNDLLSRAPRIRLSAEQVRDQVLAVSGLLNEKMFGPSVMPYQPEGVWKVISSNAKWVMSEQEDTYRRAIYTYKRKTSPYPSMASFDSPSGEVCVSRRINTNTPLQALVTLNDPVFVEAANALARITAQKSDDINDQINYAFQKALLRIPSDQEMDIMKNLYQEVNLDKESNEEMKLEVASMDREVLKTPMSVVANAILNLDEFVTRQ